MNGLRVDIEVADPGDCPVATASDTADSPAHSVRWTDEGGAVTEEFVADGAAESLDGDARPVYDYGDETVYRFSRDPDQPCVCARVEEALDVPVADVTAEGGALVLTLHLDGVDSLRDLVADLRESFAGITVRSLTRTGDLGDGSDVVTVDRGRLTDRQREVLETAHEMGYFDYPRSANAGEVADELGITTSTFTQHLTAAQSKLMVELRDADHSTGADQVGEVPSGPNRE